MRLTDATDPAIEAASLALSGRRHGPQSRFASIELRTESRSGSRIAQLAHLAPFGYAVSVLLGLVAVSVAWMF
jgi:hypothetical protein